MGRFSSTVAASVVALAIHLAAHAEEKPFDRAQGREALSEVERPVARPELATALAGAGEVVTLSGARSTGPSGKPLAFRWAQAAGPRVRLTAAQCARGELSLKLKEPGEYLFTLTVLDGRVESDPAVVRVEALANKRTGRADQRPVAVGRSSAAAVTVGEKISLDGTLSADKDGDPLEYMWTKVSGPPGNPASPRSARTELWALLPGEYVVELVVHDGALASQPSAVRVTVSPSRPARVAGKVGPMDRLVDIDLRGGDLQKAVDLFQARTGVALMVDPAFARPEALRSIPVSIRASSLPARKLCDWVARQAGAQWRVERGNSAWLTRGFGFLHAEEMTAESYPLQGLHAAEDGSDVLDEARDLVKAALFARPDASVELDAGAGAITAILPESAQARLRALFALLRAPARAVPGAACLDAFPEKALSADVRCSHGGAAALEEVLDDLSEQTGLSFGWNPAEAKPGDAGVDLDLGRVRLKVALDAIAKRFGWRGWQAEAPSGVWLYGEPGAPPETSEHLWAGSVVSAYDLRRLAGGRSVPGGVVEHLIRRRIRPESWRDPSASISFNRATERLIVANSPHVHAEVARFLEFLESVGYKHFGTGFRTGAESADEAAPQPEGSR